MIIKDKIYGEFEVTEPVLLELLKSKAVLRLKNISQYGIPNEYFFCPDLNRYDHSVGVMLLLIKFGADLEEQIAGLLHDVAHFAFSHTAEFVFGEAKNGIENLHDLEKEKFIFETDIPQILEKYSFSISDILNDERHTLLEKNIPDICADRIDYALRQLSDLGQNEIVQKCINGLIVKEKEIVFKNIEVADLFTKNFLMLQNKYWASEKTVTILSLLTEMFEIAIKEKNLKKTDFYKDDEYIMRKIRKSTNNRIIEIQKILSSGLIGNKKKGEKIFKKFRYVDPKVSLDEQLVRLSEIHIDYKNELEYQKSLSAEGIVV